MHTVDILAKGLDMPPLDMPPVPIPEGTRCAMTGYPIQIVGTPVETEAL